MSAHSGSSNAALLSTLLRDLAKLGKVNFKQFIAGMREEGGTFREDG